MSESKELTVPERAAIAVGAAEHEKHLVTLAKKYSDITKIANVAGRDQVHAGYMELKNARVAIEKAGKDAREDANAFQKAVIEEVKRLTAITTEEEARLQALRDEYDAEREREKAAKAAAEKARVDGIRKRIAEIQAVPSLLVGKPSRTVATAVEGLEELEITEESFAEFVDEAKAVHLMAVAKLNDMLSAQITHEAEQARIADERAALERERVAAAERDRVAAAARAEQERRDREAREAEERRLRAEREAHEAELRRQREAEEARLAAERERAEAEMRAQREELERQQAEIDRQRAEAERVEGERLKAIEAEEQRQREEAETAAQAEAERVEAERRAVEQERLRREQIEFEKNGPGEAEIIRVLTENFEVEDKIALHWIATFDLAYLEPAERVA